MVVTCEGEVVESGPDTGGERRLGLEKSLKEKTVVE